jgi:hypothetical protein
MMSNYSTGELKQGYTALYTSCNNKMWQDINIELARRLDKDDYINFTETCRNEYKINIGKLKNYLDDTVGKQGYICIYNSHERFLCEGTVSKLRESPLWRLIDEENIDVACSYLGQSESGEDAIIIILHSR